jgi:hypothetical protein
MPKKSKGTGWRQHEINKLIKSQIDDTSYHHLVNKGVWPINGVHKGKEISELTVSYLEFIISRFSKTSYARQIAIKELSNRQIKK